MTRQFKFARLCACLLALPWSGWALAAQDSFSGIVQTMDQLAAKHERAEATARLAKKFHPFIVAQKSAEMLLSGVQDGKSIALNGPADGGVERIKPATKSMSLANAYVALSFARLDLARYGISQPTPEQLKMALNGGKFKQSGASGQRAVHLKGVLKQRNKGQSWDAVAKSIGVSADKVRYDMEAAKFVLMREAVSPSYSSIKAFPEAQDDGQASVRKKGEKAYGVGIVTANGASPTILKSINGEQIEGIVTAGGDFIVLGRADKTSSPSKSGGL